MRSVKPLNYDLSLFDLEFGGGWSYKGRVKITLGVSQSTHEIVINTKDLEIGNAEVLGQDGSITASMDTVSYDTTNERAILKFSSGLPEGRAVLAIDFKGTMNNAMGGFYRSRYKPTVAPATSTAQEGEYHYMFSTQFEACDARRAFPCFDEPNLKATFEFEIEIPEDQVALSNMPEKAVREGSKTGLKKISFQRTPAMSTYVSIPKSRMRKLRG